MSSKPSQNYLYDAYARFIRTILLVTGLDWNRTSLLYKNLSTCTVILSFVTGIGYFNICVKNVTNIPVLTRSFGGAMAVVSVILKVLLFRVNRKKLRDINDILDRQMEHALKEGRLGPMADSPVRFFYTLAQVYLVALAMINVFSVANPLVVTINEIRRTGKCEMRVSTLTTDYPWHIGDSYILYGLRWLFELTALCLMTAVSGAVDGAFGFFALRMSTAFAMIAHELEHYCNGEKAEDRLRRCIEKHLELLRCRDGIQEIYGAIVLLMAGMNAFTVCVIVFQVSQKRHRMTMLFRLKCVSLLTVKLIQSFVYALSGTIVASKAETIRREVTYVSWYEAGHRRLARAAMIVLTQRPFTMKACRVIDVSQQLFAAIINNAISYFLMLKTLDETN